MKLAELRWWLRYNNNIMKLYKHVSPPQSIFRNLRTVDIIQEHKSDCCPFRYSLYYQLIHWVGLAKVVEETNISDFVSTWLYARQFSSKLCRQTPTFFLFYFPAKTGALNFRKSFAKLEWQSLLRFQSNITMTAASIKD